MKSGMLAAEAVFEAISNNQSEATSYQERFENSWLHKELYETRNIHSYFKHGLIAGTILSGIDCILFRGKTFWNYHDKQQDHEKLLEISKVKKIEYPKPDGKISFDILTNLSRSATNHDHDQPAHLVLKVKLILLKFRMQANQRRLIYQNSEVLNNISVLQKFTNMLKKTEKRNYKSMLKIVYIAKLVTSKMLNKILITTSQSTEEVQIILPCKI
jgi:hypothetical protein